MTQAEFVINRFGGLSKLAAALGHKHPSTVQGWLQRGFIPSSRHLDVLAAAESAGIELTAEDIVKGASSKDEAAA